MASCNLNTPTANLNVAVLHDPRGEGTSTSLKIVPHVGYQTLYLNYRYSGVGHAAYLWLNKLGRSPGLFPFYGKRRAEELGVNFEDGLWFYRKGLDVGSVVQCLPYFLNRVPDNLILDEDETIRWLKPHSILLLGVKHPHGKIAHIYGLFKEDIIENIPRYLAKEYPEWAEWVKRLDEVCDPKSIRRPAEVFEEIKRNLPPPPYVNLPLEDRVKMAEEVLANLYPWNEYPIVNLFVASLFFKSYYVRAKQTKRELWLVCDEDVLLFKGWLSKIRNIVVRSYDKRLALWFFNQLGRQAAVMEKSFPYKNNFLVFETDIEAVMEKLLEEDIPFLVLCATKEEAEEAYSWFEQKKLHEKAIQANERFTPNQVYNVWREGKCIIFYENSTISRGVDLNIYDVLIVWSEGFAAPYEEFLAETTGDKTRLEERLTMELEQNLVRTSPVPDDWQDQLKFIICKRKPQLNLLADRYIGKVDAGYLAEVILPICPKVEKREVKGEFLENWAGQPRVYYGRTINYMHSHEIKLPETPPILFINAVLHANLESVKSVMLKQVKPHQLDEWFTRLLTRLAHRRSAPCRAEVEEYLKDLISDKVLRNAFINILVELGIFKKVKKGKYTYYVLQAERGKGLYRPYKHKDVMCEIAEALLRGHFSELKLFVPDRPASYPKQTQYVDRGRELTGALREGR